MAVHKTLLCIFSCQSVEDGVIFFTYGAVQVSSLFTTRIIPSSVSNFMAYVPTSTQAQVSLGVQGSNTCVRTCGNILPPETEEPGNKTEGGHVCVKFLMQKEAALTALKGKVKEKVERNFEIEVQMTMNGNIIDQSVACGMSESECRLGLRSILDLVY